MRGTSILHEHIYCIPNFAHLFIGFLVSSVDDIFLNGNSCGSGRDHSILRNCEVLIYNHADP